MKSIIAILGAIFCAWLAVMLYRDYRVLHKLQVETSDVPSDVSHRPIWIGALLGLLFLSFGIMCVLYSFGLLDDVVLHFTNIKFYGMFGGV